MKTKQKNNKPNKQKNRPTEERLELKDWRAEAGGKYRALEVVGGLREGEGRTLPMELQHFPIEKTQKARNKEKWCRDFQQDEV